MVESRISGLDRLYFKEVGVGGASNWEEGGGGGGGVVFFFFLFFWGGGGKRGGKRGRCGLGVRVGELMW